MDELSVQCCITGGGPAGMMAGFLLARAGVDVLVLEKHADFLRDFRGDTIHPSTLELMHELGLLEDFLKLPHQKARGINAQVGDVALPFADFTHLPTHCRFLVFMPQWHFLDFLARQAKRYPSFKLRMQADVTELVEEGGRVTGLRATTPEGPFEVRANLVVGADGRHSTVRERARLEVEELGAPMDVLWFRLARDPRDPEETMGRFDAGRVFIAINRGEYWQCGYVIAKGSLDQLRARGIDAFRDDVARLAPFAGDRARGIRDWDEVKLLTVSVNRLRQWYRAGVLCIGDAAHAMSPVGGVGINLAVQDAVATANLLAAPLREGRLTLDNLRQVQRRREWPARVTQAAQVFIQKRVISRVLSDASVIAPPLPLRLFARFPLLRRIPARLVGIGVRPEHIRTPELSG
jgi:2-polyprenyl-6-methoxyphenol hydroxylase-like FAD-dependent oxidoreductase